MISDKSINDAARALTWVKLRGHTPWLVKAYGKCIEYGELLLSWRALGEYYESLGNSEEARYIVKLEAVGLTPEDDQNSKESGRIIETNMKSWPPINYSHSFGYSFISLLFTQVCIDPLRG